MSSPGDRTNETTYSGDLGATFTCRTTAIERKRGVHIDECTGSPWASEIYHLSQSNVSNNRTTTVRSLEIVRGIDILANGWIARFDQNRFFTI
jgi:hypothetical protein